MNDNLLLQRPRLGRPLERGYTMPVNMTFGRPNYKIDGGTGNGGKRILDHNVLIMTFKYI